MSSPLYLKDHWIWDPVVSLVSMLIVCLLITVSLYYLFPLYHSKSLFIVLVFIPFVFIFLRYKNINKMINVLKGCISAQNGEVVASLLHFNDKSLPGVAILRDDVIILIPIYGRRHKIFFTKIKKIEEIKKIPGKWLVGKRIFSISFENKPSVYFAVAGSIGEKWSISFQNINQSILNS